jgi:hypothetical protein
LKRKQHKHPFEKKLESWQQKAHHSATLLKIVNCDNNKVLMKTRDWITRRPMQFPVATHHILECQVEVDHELQNTYHANPDPSSQESFSQMLQWLTNFWCFLWFCHGYNA